MSAKAEEGALHRMTLGEIAMARRVYGDSIVYSRVWMDLTLYIQTHFLSYGCDNFLRINSRGERYPSALCG